MNNDLNQSRFPTHRDEVVADEIDLLDILLVLVKYKKMIFLACGAVFILSASYSLTLPDVYTATARVFSPQSEKGGLGSMLGGMGDLAALAGISPGGSSDEFYVGILKSRTVANVVIDRFKLMEVYGKEYRRSVYETLNRVVKVSTGKKDGIISISVDDEDPRRAEQMANAYVDELKRINIQINLSSAGRQRQFLENRLSVVREDLIKAEDAVKEFQKENKAIRIDDQASAIIDAIAQLKGDLTGKEVQLGVLRSYQTEQNPEVKALKESITQVKEQIRRLERTPSGEKVAGDVFISTSEVPELGVQYARLLRNFKVQETLFELLSKQHEVAKIEEAKNTSIIQVLDEAVAPDQKSKPKRLLIVIVATFAAALLTVLIAFIREYFERLSEEDRGRWQEIKEYFKSTRQKE